MSDAPVYKATPLNSLKDICRTFGVGKDRVKQWISMGAPIGREENGKKVTYFAETAKLQLWREATFSVKDACFDEEDGEL